MIFLIQYGYYEDPDEITEFETEEDFLKWHEKADANEISNIRLIISGTEKVIYIKESEIVKEWGLE